MNDILWFLIIIIGVLIIGIGLLISLLIVTFGNDVEKSFKSEKWLDDEGNEYEY